MNRPGSIRAVQIPRREKIPKRYRRTLQLKMSQLYQNTTGKSRKTVHICIPFCQQLLLFHENVPICQTYGLYYVSE